MTLRIVLLVAGALFAAAIIYAGIRQRKLERGLILPKNRKDESLIADEALDDVWQNEILGKSRVIGTNPQKNQEEQGGIHSTPSPSLKKIASLDDRIFSADEKKQSIQSSPQELIVFYIMAKDNQKFPGYKLLHSLSGCGLTHGPLSIFHYFDRTHYKQDNKQTVWFSVASAAEPGKFDIQRMGSLMCPGICLFMNFKNQDSLKAYNKLLMTAQQLVKDLHGELLDDRRQPCSQQYLEECRDRILNHSMNSQEELAMAE